MSSTLYKAGRSLGAFQRGTVTCSPSAASVSAATNLGDGDPSTPLIWGSIAADSYGQADIQALTNPGFETSTLTGWTAGSAGTGTSAEETGTFRTGAKALKLVGTDSSNYGSRYQDIVVYAGEYRKESVYIKTLTAGTAKLFLKNLKTGLYYNGSAWASTRAAAVSQAATGSFVAMTVTYQMESFDACREDYVSLRWELVCESGTVFFDDCLSVFGVSFAGVFGHNLGPVVPTVRSSDDASSWTDRSAMTIRRIAFFSTFSTIYAQYWRLVLVGTNHEAPYCGEVVLDQYQTSATACQWGLADSRDFPAARASGASKRTTTYNFAKDPPESIKLSFSPRSSTASKELADALWLRSEQGRYPVILVPIDTEDGVFFGRITEPRTVDRPFQGVYMLDLSLVGDPLPTLGA